uniref:Multicopper oxidase n=1 Tax=Auricularia auricula-judae TaxID=29892 RepID=Q6RYA3_AURAJ|nr:multicopper oxidase [Auricularia auricula-judae]
MAPAQRSKHAHTIVILLVAGVALLALVLGLGLGLGLRNRNKDASAASGATSNLSSQLTAQNGSHAFFIRGAAAMAKDPPQTREYNFTISNVRGAPAGVEKDMVVVNNIWPGPTIEVNQHDRVVIRVMNRAQNATAIHWHGLYQRGTPFYDGTHGITQCGIPPGQDLVYNFTLGDFSGTTWWHSHYMTQYTDGVTGAFIVHPTNATVSAPTYDTDSLIQVGDMYHTISDKLLAAFTSPSGIDGTPGDEPVPDTGTINGMGQYGVNGSQVGTCYKLTLAPNATHRLRIINSGSFADVRFSVDGHPLTVVETDGVEVAPYVVEAVQVSVAQRYSVLLTTNNTAGVYWMRAVVQEDMFTYDQPGFNGNALGVLQYTGVDNSTMPDPGLVDNNPGTGKNLTLMDTALLRPASKQHPPKATLTYKITVSFQVTADNGFFAFINSTSWTPLSGSPTLFSHLGADTVGANTFDNSQLILTSPNSEVIDLIIDNLDDGDHPFHLHGYKFWIMGTGDGRYQGQDVDDVVNPLLRDTHLIPSFTWTVLRFVANNPGAWAFHCHISWHMAIGLLVQFYTMPTEAAGLLLPQDMVDQCSTEGASARVR